MENNPTPVQKKWYNNKTWVIVLCVFLFPVGLYGVFKSDSFGTVGKSIAAVYLALILWGFFADKSPVEAPIREAKPELTQAQHDSTEQQGLATQIASREQSTVDAGSLVEVYEENEVRADDQYKGKWIYVEGRVETIGKDIFDNPYVTLASGNGISMVQCTMANSGDAAKLDKGQRVAIRGKVKGKALMAVLLDKCELAESIAQLRKNLQ